MVNAMLNDWNYGVKCEIHMRCDSSAVRGMGRDWGKLDMLTYVSRGYNKQYKKDV